MATVLLRETWLTLVRRSNRIRVPPLAHWRGERIVYELEGRRASGPALPKIKEIVRIDTPPQRPRSTQPTAYKRKARAESDSDDDESDAGEVWAPIKVYGDDTAIEEYRIAVSKSALDPQPLQGSKVRFEKVFQDGDYMASGVMDISVGGAKGIKSTRHSYMSFAVMTGKVEVKVHRTAFIIGKGGVFVVPRGSISSSMVSDARQFLLH
jgi:centromere protein C